MNGPKIQRPIGFHPREISALFNREVITQHAEEAAFLWLLRDAAAGAPNYSLNDLAELDERVEAHIDGLRVAGNVGWEIAAEALGNEEPGEVFVAAVLAFESGEAERIAKVMEVGFSKPELLRALVSALGWPSFEAVNKVINWFLASGEAQFRYLGIAASAIHRRDPGKKLNEAVIDPDERVRARALKATGELGRIDLLPWVMRQINDKNDACRFHAARAAALLGQRHAQVIAALQNLTHTNEVYAERAMTMALRAMPLRDAKIWQEQLWGKPERLRLAAIGAGIIGDPAFAPVLIKMLGNQEHTRVAGEAFAMITGVDLAYEDLDGDAPEGFEAGPSEEAEDEEVAMDPDEDLPWPVPERVAKWWQENRGKFKGGVRYLCGKEITKPALQEILAKGQQRQRAAAALELALSNPKLPLFEVRMPGKRQQQMLGSWISSTKQK